MDEPTNRSDRGGRVMTFDEAVTQINDYDIDQEYKALMLFVVECLSDNYGSDDISDFERYIQDESKSEYEEWQYCQRGLNGGEYENLGEDISEEEWLYSMNVAEENIERLEGAKWALYKFKQWRKGMVADHESN